MASRFAHRATVSGRLTAGAKITRKIKHFPEAPAWFSNSKSGSPIVFAPFSKKNTNLEIASIPLETPPDLRLGEIATPIAFELARKLRKAPKIIAQEIVDAIVADLGQLSGFSKFEVAGAGYINAYLDRAAAAQLVVPADTHPPSEQGHVLVEHTSINPNKAAHIGHLRNAILGDTFVRLLRAAGYKVDVQNYIDNTGVQVADVVVGFLHLEKKSPADVRALLADLARKGERIDYYCWDLYARTSQWYGEGTAEEQAARKQIRLDTLHLIEHGGNDTAEIADLISTAVLRRHLETMLRLGIEYDFLPRESEILHLKFWEAAFEKLKQSGVLYFENEGKNKGCWVMTRPGAEINRRRTDDDAKVIVRSNGTVTYVGKDIAYHLWKFGLLGKDFGYKRFFTYPDHECWISAESGEPNHPHFGGASAIYNVIDARQSDPQANVIQALRGMGYTEQADHYTHFSYEMVALTPRCAVELGYNISDEDQTKILHRSQRPQGLRRQGRRPHRQAHRRHARRSRRAPDRRRRRECRGHAPEDRRANRHRRPALLHAQGHAQLRHRFRFQRRAQL